MGAEVGAAILVPGEACILARSGDGEQLHLGAVARGHRLRVGPQSGEDLHPHVASPDLAVAGAVTSDMPTTPGWHQRTAVIADPPLGLWGATLARHRFAALSFAPSYSAKDGERTGRLFPQNDERPPREPSAGMKAQSSTKPVGSVVVLPASSPPERRNLGFIVCRDQASRSALRFRALDPAGRRAGMLAGRSGGEGPLFSRWFTRSSRPLAVPLPPVLAGAQPCGSARRDAGAADAASAASVAVYFARVCVWSGQRGATPGEVEFHRRY